VDAYTLFAFGFTGLLWAALGFLVGRVHRDYRYRRDAAANLALANKRYNERRDARAHANRVTYAAADSDRDDDGDGDASTGPGIHQARRRTVHRPHNRHSAVSFDSDGNIRSTDEASLAGSL